MEKVAERKVLTKSRVGKRPVVVPAGVEVQFSGTEITVKGKQGQLSLNIHRDVVFDQSKDEITFSPRIQSKQAKALTGTMRALVNNMVQGVSIGFVRELALVGVGYRAQVSGKTLVLSLGYSHPINYAVPTSITIETPSATEIVIKGADRQEVGEVAAQIRRFRPPEPYKSKGVRNKNEIIRTKEVKKKK